jgi:hypothetical protein
MTTDYELHDSHRPVLSSGSYSVSASWKVFVDGVKQEEAIEDTGFHVAGERFSLKPSDIQALYPPEGSQGIYGNSLPHIVLSGDTLAWERSAKPGSDAPWLALLLLAKEESEACPLRTMTLAEYRRTAALTLEPGQQDSDVVEVIEAPAALLHSVLPTLSELPRLCHVRVSKNGGSTTDSAAVVVSKRIPAHGRNTVHLVALEDRYPDLESRYLGSDFASQPACVLISLKSWSFTCEARNSPQPESLDKLFQRLDVSWLQLKGNEHYLSFGFVPLQHHFRTGESAASWYRGPLCSGPSRNVGAELVTLPAQSADELLWYDENFKMLNVTYAAAWELGRLLAMQNRRVYSLLHNWRRKQIHCAHAVAAGGMGESCCHLPQVQCACAAKVPDPPVELINWVDGLRKLQGVPYRYLMADERLLPSESLRFFSIDPLYINALLDGGLSSVRAPSHCPEHCRAGELALLSRNPPGSVTGFLFRSAAVAGWPNLEVSTLDSRGKALELYHRAQLSPTIMLYMFRGVIATVTIEQRSDTVHLSVPGPDNDANHPARNINPLQYNSSSEFANSLVQPPQALKLSVTW